MLDASVHRMIKPDHRRDFLSLFLEFKDRVYLSRILAFSEIIELRSDGHKWEVPPF